MSATAYVSGRRSHKYLNSATLIGQATKVADDLSTSVSPILEVLLGGAANRRSSWANN